MQYFRRVFEEKTYVEKNTEYATYWLMDNLRYKKSDKLSGQGVISEIEKDCNQDKRNKLLCP